MKTRALWAVGLALAAVLLLPSFATGGTTERVSVSSTGEQGEPGSDCYDCSISADGRFVAFDSTASNLVPFDANGTRDVFIRDRGTATTNPSTKRVSVATGGGDPNAECWAIGISANGQYVAFVSPATNLVDGDTNGFWDVFVWEAATGKITRVSVGPNGAEGDGNSGIDTWSCAISGDGQRVAFESRATNLVAGGTDGTRNAFVRDRLSGVTTLASVAANGGPANGNSRYPTISADGRFVAFVSDATNLVEGDTNRVTDVFVRDLDLGVTRRVNVASDGTQANDQSMYSPALGPALSAEGRYVAFDSLATNLVPANNNKRLQCRIYVHDQQEHTTTLVSVSSDGTPANQLSWNPAISADGRYVAFDSSADNLVPADTNGIKDIFVHDRVTGETTRVSVASAGTQADRGSFCPTITSDGRFIAFDSAATNLVPGDTNGVNGTADIFVHDRGAAPPGVVSVKSVVANDIRLGAKYSITATISNGTAEAVTVDAECRVSGAGGSQSLQTRPVLVPAGGTATVKFDDASDSSLPKGTYTATVTIPDHDPIGAQDPFRIR